MVDHTRGSSPTGFWTMVVEPMRGKTNHISGPRSAKRGPAHGRNPKGLRKSGLVWSGLAWVRMCKSYTEKKENGSQAGRGPPLTQPAGARDRPADQPTDQLTDRLADILSDPTTLPNQHAQGENQIPRRAQPHFDRSTPPNLALEM